MIREEDVYRIGKLGRPHGVKGEISFMFDDDVFDVVDCDYLVLSLDGLLVPFFIEEYRFKGAETALMKFEGIDTQERASQLTGTSVYFPRLLAERQEGASWAEMVGYRLLDEDGGGLVGIIRHVDDSTANVLFEVETPAGQVVLVPASEELITHIDKQLGQIAVRIPEGLMDL